MVLFREISLGVHVGAIQPDTLPPRAPMHPSRHVLHLDRYRS